MTNNDMITVNIFITYSALWNGCRQVQFSTVIYGTFRQSLALDFGADSAALIQHMTVHCKPVCDELTRLNRTLVTDKTEYWMLANKTVVPYEPKFVMFFWLSHNLFLCTDYAVWSSFLLHLLCQERQCLWINGISCQELPMCEIGLFISIVEEILAACPSSSR